MTERRLRNYRFDLSALRQSISAGEPLNPEVITQWKNYTGTEIRDFYGQTESTAMIGNPPWMTGKMRSGSFGYPSFMYDVKLVDDEGKEVNTPDEPGHIVVRLDRWRALGLFTEYIGSPEKMESVFVDNYYYTGDRASFDAEGYWWFVGRADDVIKSSDYRVGPFEVESALVLHEDIAEAGAGPLAVEVDLMQPIDPEARPRVHEPALNHIGLWVDDLAAAVSWLEEQGMRFTPGGIRKGAAGHDVCFIHPKGNEAAPIGGEGVLIELVEAPAEVGGDLAGDEGQPRGLDRSSGHQPLQVEPGLRLHVVRVGLERLADGEAVGTRHPDVEQGNIRRHLFYAS